MEAPNVASFIALGREIQRELDRRGGAEHPDDDRLSGLYGVMFFQEVESAERVHQRSITIFADGEVDRSPCGSGTSARLALLHADGELERGEWMVHESVIGTTFLARVVEEASVHGRPAVITEIEGSASLTGYHEFALRRDDELGTGFILR